MEFLIAQTQSTGSAQFAAYLPFILIFFVFYFIVIRPQSKERKRHESQLANLKQGDKILTRGGIYGSIVGFQGKQKNRITIDTGFGTKFNVARSYVAGLEDEKGESK